MLSGIEKIKVVISVPFKAIFKILLIMKIGLASLLIAFITLPLLSQNSSPGGVSGSSLVLNSTEKKSSDSIRDLNFNPPLELMGLKSEYSNLIPRQYAFFSVFKSESTEDKKLFNIVRGNHKVVITNNSVKSNIDVPYSKSMSNKGTILSFMASTNQNGKKNNGLSIEDVGKNKTEQKKYLYEVIFYPKQLSSLEKHKVETYLSLKYGVSINGDFDYINSANDTIWKYNEHKEYNTRVTGISRDDASGLYQKQSGNSEKDGLYIGRGKIEKSNLDNTSQLKNLSSLLWADNGFSAEFEKSTGEDIRVMKRKWNIQKHNLATSDSFQIKISKKLMNLPKLTKDEDFWLVLNQVNGSELDITSAKYIRQTAEDETYIYFNDITLEDEDNSILFTFAIGPQSFVRSAFDIDCFNTLPGTATLYIKGGQPPFNYTISSAEGFSKTENSLQEEYTFTKLPEGNYTFSVEDATKNILKTNILVKKVNNSNVTLKDSWNLDKNGKVIVTPTINTGNGLLTFEWIKDDQKISTSSSATLSEAGQYILKVADEKGCAVDLPFTVKPIGSSLSVYPNPVKKGSAFYLDFKLTSKADVSFRISSLEGKIHLVKDLGVVDSYIFPYTLYLPGVYLITVYTDGKEETTKLIVTD